MFDPLPPLLEAAATPALVWLSTYLLHSTVLLGAAWALSRLPALAGPATQDALWKAAILGGVVTASVFAGGGGWAEWDVLPAATPDVPAAEAAFSTVVTDEAFVLHDFSAGEGFVFAEPSPMPAGSDAPLQPLSVPALLGLLWALGATIEGLRRTRHHRRFLDALGIRARVEEGDAPLVLADLAHRAGVRRPVRLTTSAVLRSPVALDGWRRAEVCVPGAALALPPAELRALLAHEVAHLARRDPAWLGVFALVESLLWMQPLNRLARRGQQEAAEALCDGWAATQSAPTAMAACLLQVAEWLRAPGGLRAYVVPSPVAVGMAARPSALRGRVERLVADRPARIGRALPAIAVVVALAGLVAGTGFSQSAPWQPDAFAFSTFEEEPLAEMDPMVDEWWDEGLDMAGEDEVSVGLGSGAAVTVRVPGPVVRSAPRADVRTLRVQSRTAAPSAPRAPPAPRFQSTVRLQASEEADIRRSVRAAGLSSGFANFVVNVSDLGVAAAEAAVSNLAQSGVMAELEGLSPEEAVAARVALSEARRALAETGFRLQQGCEHPGCDAQELHRMQREHEVRHAAELDALAADLEREAAELERQAAELRRRLDANR